MYTECSNPAKGRCAKYICNHENNLPSWLSLQRVCGNLSTWAQNAQLNIGDTDEPRVFNKQSKRSYVSP